MPVAAKKPAAKKAAAKKPGVTKLVTEFVFGRETPGTLKFDETGDKADHVCGAVYIKKPVLDGTKPQHIRVTIEVLEEQAE